MDENIDLSITVTPKIPYCAKDLCQTAYCLAFEVFETTRRARSVKLEHCFWTLMKSWKWRTLKSSINYCTPLQWYEGSVSTEEIEVCERNDSAMSTALQRLLPVEKKIARHLSDGWSRQQMANRLGITEKTLLNRIAVARKKLQKEINL